MSLSYPKLPKKTLLSRKPRKNDERSASFSPELASMSLYTRGVKSDQKQRLPNILSVVDEIAVREEGIIVGMHYSIINSLTAIGLKCAIEAESQIVIRGLAQILYRHSSQKQ